MSEASRGQVSSAAAEVYEKFFVPALFQGWAGKVADAARIQRGDRVLDVACGTGILAVEAARRVYPGGSVVGLDLNPGMLAVARRKSPNLDWREGAAEALLFKTDSFDCVVSQFGLMFFEDPRTAVLEMFRVLRPGGRLAVAVWAPLEQSPGYAAMTELLERLFGNRVADALRAPFALGDKTKLSSLFTDARSENVIITTLEGIASFPSIRSWVHTDVKGWTLGDVISESQHQQLVEESERELQQFVDSSGAVSFSISAHLVTATRTG
jgi:ubiquinone/menaquinone biosynthesis C-methylase UbiE